MDISKLEKAIFLTISYSRVFNFPLTRKEIELRLIGVKNILPQDLRKVLTKLVERGKLFKKGEFYFLKDSEKDVLLRENRAKIALEKRKDARQFVSWAKKIPLIRAIVITGSLSTNNTNLNDDVDWLIITTKGRLWLVRPLVLLISSFFGRRRQRNGNHRDNSWCFNMFLEESSLGLPPGKRNVYTAYEVCQADFIFNKSNTEALFLKKNKWVSDFLPAFYEKRLADSLAEKSRGVFKTRGLESWLGYFLDFVNSFFFYLQYWYMKNHITGETVGLNLAFFHPRNTRGKIMREWIKIIRKNNGELFS